MTVRTNLPILDRRSFVAALAASLSSTAAAQASGTETVKEHPDLLEMSDRLPGTLQTYKDAAAKVHSIAKTWGPQGPTPDLKIVSYMDSSKRHADILGWGVKTPWGNSGKMRVQNLGTPEVFEASHLKHKKEAERKSKLKSQRGMKYELLWADRHKACIQPARAYWSEVERIEAESGINDAQEIEASARKALRKLVGDILPLRNKRP